MLSTNFNVCFSVAYEECSYVLSQVCELAGNYFSSVVLIINMSSLKCKNPDWMKNGLKTANMV